MASKREDMRWQDSALCKKYSPELFYPDGDKRPEFLFQIMYAKNVCSVCPVRYQCLAEALTGNEAGIWGATTENDRKTMRQYLKDIPWERAGAAGLAYVLGVLMPVCEGCGDHKRTTRDRLCYPCRVEFIAKLAAAKEQAA